MLSIKTYLLTSGNSYRLQVDYDGGQTGILSFTYSDELVLEGYYKGDRDGGDAKGKRKTAVRDFFDDDLDLIVILEVLW